MSKSSSLLPLIINYVQILNDNSPTITADDLSNGLGFQLLLKHMGYEVSLHEPLTFVQAFQNLKMINDRVVQEAIKHHLYHIEEEIDLMEIAQNKSPENIWRLFLRCQAVALKGNNKQYFIQKMLRLPQSDQSLLVNNLKDLMERREQVSTNDILLHKITQLQHQSIRFQKLLQQQLSTNSGLNQRIEELTNRILSYEQMFESQDSLILSPKYSKQHSERKSFTPNQSRNDSFNKYQAQISQLQYQLDITKSSQASLINIKEKYQGLSAKYDELLSNSSGVLEKQQEIKNMHTLIMEKESLIENYKQHIKELSGKNQQLHNTSIKDNINIKLQDLKIKQLSIQVDRLKQQQHQSNYIEREPLSEICPGINQQIHDLRENNENLLENINKTTKRMSLIEKELQRYKRQNHKLGNLERENKKLEQILMDYNNSRGEENDVLVGCLYQLRMKFNSQVLAPMKKDRREKETKGRYD